MKNINKVDASKGMTPNKAQRRPGMPQSSPVNKIKTPGK